VKMLGENPDEIEEARGVQGALISKPGWQRFLILVAGPGANILLAIMLPAALFMISYGTLAYRQQPARVGYVRPGSPAEKAGIKKADVIVHFDGIDQPTWEDVENFTALKPGQQVPVVVERAGQRQELPLTLETEQLTGGTVGISGLVPDVPVRVGRVEAGLPAAKAGLRPGDTILRIQGVPINSMQEVQAIVSPNVDRPLAFTIVRDGQTLDMTITPFFDKALGYGRIGFADDPPVIHEQLNPLQALSASIDKNLRDLWMMKEAFAGVLSGQRSVRDTFAGPVSIAVVSGEVVQQGIEPLLLLLSLLSLSLGIFNLLPIPILDGGQVLMLFLEKGFRWFGGELSVALREKIQTIGFAVIVLLMGYIIYADIARLMQ